MPESVYGVDRRNAREFRVWDSRFEYLHLFREKYLPAWWCVPYKLIDTGRWGYLRLSGYSRTEVIAQAEERHRGRYRWSEYVGRGFKTRSLGMTVKARIVMEYHEPFLIDWKQLKVANEDGPQDINGEFGVKKPWDLSHRDIERYHKRLLEEAEATASGDFDPATPEERKELDRLGDANV